jgi:hypothetical protein
MIVRWRADWNMRVDKRPRADRQIRCYQQTTRQGRTPVLRLTLITSAKTLTSAHLPE